MVRTSDLVVWIKDIEKEDSIYVGEKAASLGDLQQAGFSIPNGFVVTGTAYLDFLRINKLEKPITHLLNTVNYNDPSSIKQVSLHIKKLISQGNISSEISQDIFSKYEKVSPRDSNPQVELSTSVITNVKDTHALIEHSSIAVNGEASVLHALRETWASLYDVHTLSKCHHTHTDISHLKIAVLVQKSVLSQTSGVLFTVNPVTNEKDSIVIEAVYGHKEYISINETVVDRYTVNKKNMQITEKIITGQSESIVKTKNQSKIISIPNKMRSAQKISDDEIISISKIALKLENHFYFPQSCEWSQENGSIFVTGTAPIISQVELIPAREPDSSCITKSSRTILFGDPVSAGIGIGSVRLVRSKNDLQKVKNGDILVADSTSKEYLPAMRRASAIITQRGGRTSFTAINSRALGTPAVVDAVNAFKLLKDGMILTVNGKTGEITRGSIHTANTDLLTVSVHPKIKTDVLAAVMEETHVAEMTEFPISGIGLLDITQVIVENGIHPKKLIHDKMGHEYVSLLAEKIGLVCKQFYPSPVQVSLSDLTSSEYHCLDGGKEYEPRESNPSLGYHGAFRHVNDPRVLELELQAIWKVREKMQLNNLSLIIPYTRSVRELEVIKKAISASGLRRSSTFKVSLSCEIPSNVILIDEYLRVGVDGVIIKLDGLTSLLLGLDRDNEETASEFNERHPAVLWAIEQVIKNCKKRSVPVSIYGSALSRYPDLIEKLVEWKISSITTTPDHIGVISEYIYNAEKSSK